MGVTRIGLVSAPTETDREYASVLKYADEAEGPRDYPLGILTLAAELEGSCFVPEIVDLNCWYVDFLRSAQPAAQRDFGSYAADRIARRNYPIVGFGTICSSYPLTLTIAQKLKQLKPSTSVIFGGPQASVVDMATLHSLPFVDMVVRGEADQSLPALLECLENGNDLSSLRGITYRNNGRIVRTPDAPLIANLDSLPLPAFHLYPGLTKARVLPLEHGRGCPFSCTFCSTNDFFRRRFRLKSPAKMLHEMDHLKAKYGVEYFDLMHDMFTVDRRKVVEFCLATLASGKRHRWGCSARTDCVDKELLELMAKAGCVSIFYGVESGSQRMQSLIDKELDVTDALAKVQSSCSFGMATVASMIIGYPEETKDDLQATLAFIGESMRHRKLEPHLHMLAPLAGTPLHHLYRNDLVLEEIYTDMSQNRLYQDQAERRIIIEYPDLFSNFYSLPTQYLDRQYLHEVREFFVRTISRFRWTLTAWHDRCGDLLSLFDEWKQWHGQPKLSPGLANLRRYYCGTQFDRDFVRFLEGRPAQQRSAFEEVLLEFEQKLMSSLDAKERDRCQAPATTMSSDSRVYLANDVHLLRLSGDLERVTTLLQLAASADSSVRNPSVVLVKGIAGTSRFEVVTPASAVAAFLALCDGRTSVALLLSHFAEKFGDLEGIPASKVAKFALRSLHQQNVIRFLPALDVAPAAEVNL